MKSVNEVRDMLKEKRGHADPNTLLDLLEEALELAPEPPAAAPAEPEPARKKRKRDE